MSRAPRTGARVPGFRKLDVALRHLREVLNLEPGHAAARITSRVLLLAENFEEGWRAWLRSVASIPLPDPAHGAAAFHDKTVVIYGTEGVGDEIMFASCVPELARHATAVTLHCERRLKPLFARSFPGVRVFAMDKEGARRTIGWVTPNEFHMLASFLPAYFAPDPSRGPRGPFLVPDPAQVAEWRRRFDALGPGLKVGVSWRGGVEAINRSRRSIPLPQWTPVLTVPGIHFVNLQYGSNDTEIAPIQDRTGVPIHGWGDADPLTDLDFFAAQVAALDQVVSVDNTTVHLAGALGTPVWALVPFVPDWRWTMAGSRSCWYSLVRLVRQNSRDTGEASCRKSGRCWKKKSPRLRGPDASRKSCYFAEFFRRIAHLVPREPHPATRGTRARERVRAAR